MSVYRKILNSKEKKQIAVLVDPDKYTEQALEKVVLLAEEHEVDYFFVGGSLMLSTRLDRCISIIKENSEKQVIIFPGSTMQVNAAADAILFLSLISGRNAELLIGNHVIAAPYIRDARLEVISTGYMIIDSGTATTASYMSQSFPIPRDKNEIAICTAIAAEMLGMKMIYLDGGSGARETVSTSMIEAVKSNISVPLVAGGGIRSPQAAIEICKAGADLIVVGNAIEDNHKTIAGIADAIHSL